MATILVEKILSRFAIYAIILAFKAVKPFLEQNPLRFTATIDSNLVVGMTAMMLYF